MTFKTVIKIKIIARNIPVLKSSLLFFWVEGEEGRREGRGGGGGGESRGANAVHLSCAISHSIASKLDAVLVDQCFTVFGGQKMKEERRDM